MTEMGAVPPGSPRKAARSPTDRLQSSIRGKLPFAHPCDLCLQPISRASKGHLVHNPAVGDLTGREPGRRIRWFRAHGRQATNGDCLTPQPAPSSVTRAIERFAIMAAKQAGCCNARFLLSIVVA